MPLVPGFTLHPHRDFRPYGQIYRHIPQTPMPRAFSSPRKYRRRPLHRSGPPVARPRGMPGGDGLFRAYVGALGAFAAPLLHGAAGRFKRGVGEHRHPPHPGAVVRGDEETVFRRSSQAGEMRGQFMGNCPCDLFVAGPFLRTAREVPGSRPAGGYLPPRARSGRESGSPHRNCCAGTALPRRNPPVGQEVHQRVEKCDADRDRPGRRSAPHPAQG